MLNTFQDLKSYGHLKRQMSYSVLFYGAELESIVLQVMKRFKIRKNLVMRTTHEGTKSHEVRSNSFLNMFK